MNAKGQTYRSSMQLQNSARIIVLSNSQTEAIDAAACCKEQIRKVLEMQSMALLKLIDARRKSSLGSS